MDYLSEIITEQNRILSHKLLNEWKQNMLQLMVFVCLHFLYFFGSTKGTANHHEHED